ncbi:MAG: hypothetical protein FJ280_03325 [Planctomycetes bacterium]|nr:hypothetical protein [Planctomycetota bacterium]
MTGRRLVVFTAMAVVAIVTLVAAPAGAQIYFSDDFNDPVASKDKWEVITGDWQVNDGLYQQVSTADPWLASLVAAKHWNDNWEEYTIEFKVRPLTTGDAPVNVLFRVEQPPKVWADRNTANSRFYRWIVNGWTNTESRPYAYNRGTATMLGQVPNSLQVGTWYHIMLVVTKTGMAGYVNGVEMFDVQHAAWTKGRVGLQAYSGKMDFDDFIVYGPAHMPDWRLKAKKPSPADGTVGVQMALFQWTAGEGAMFHNVYLGTTPDLGADQLVGPRGVLTLFYHPVPLQPGTKYYWRVDEIKADGATIHPGDVWSFVTQDTKAYYPTPADQSTTMSLTPTLSWMPGVGASQHRVFFGNDAQAVAQGATGTDKGTKAETTFVPGTLEPVTTYFWRVDETVAGGVIKAGAVWSFTTPLLVDDFESYTDTEGSAIFDTWIDGWTNNTGSQVGYIQAPFAERTIVHGGKQSMPLDYNNVKAPFYSEAQRTFAPVQNWTAGDVGTLSLFFRGRANNGAGKLYLALEDSTGKTAVVTNDAALTKNTWVEWKIPLSEFTGVNLSRVKTLYLGVGDRQTPAAGGAGRIFIDDIRLTRP